ncbi:Serine/threonine-protein kinase CAK1 [Candida viswanathii]|uniref:Serine/threonine-protein kinase CAK1 n=1 Tax=Candida viswanathii TaxID=5486 RepID=A0A367XLP1_9ASCO|nr:Serine/threonine-protein kinase CAK1 [Candida viswanathii]
MKLSDYYIDKQLIYTSPISEIYKATDKHSSLSVCLKIMDEDFQPAPHSIFREISILKRFRSQAQQHHIIEYLTDMKFFDDVVLVTTLYEYNMTNLMKTPKYCKRMSKFQDDGSISYQLINKTTDHDIRAWLACMAQALAFLRDNGVIHRDIKPSNIMFAAQDITNPVLGDFGICYDVNHPPLDEATEKHNDISSGIYKPPEVILDNGYDYGVDVWGVAIILTILYASDYKSVLEDKDEDGDTDVGDLALLNRIIVSFGTGGLECRMLELPDYQRKPSAELIPRCQDKLISELFVKMTEYDTKKRITANELYDALK